MSCLIAYWRTLQHRFQVRCRFAHAPGPAAGLWARQRFSNAWRRLVERGRPACARCRRRCRFWFAAWARRFWWFRVVLSLVVLVRSRRNVRWHLGCIGREFRDVALRFYERLAQLFR